MIVTKPRCTNQQQLKKNLSSDWADYNRLIEQPVVGSWEAINRSTQTDIGIPQLKILAQLLTQALEQGAWEPTQQERLERVIARLWTHYYGQTKPGYTLCVIHQASTELGGQPSLPILFKSHVRCTVIGQEEWLRSERRWMHYRSRGASSLDQLTVVSFRINADSPEALAQTLPPFLNEIEARVPNLLMAKAVPINGTKWTARVDLLLQRQVQDSAAACGIRTVQLMRPILAQYQQGDVKINRSLLPGPSGQPATNLGVGAHAFGCFFDSYLLHEFDPIKKGVDIARWILASYKRKFKIYGKLWNGPRSGDTEESEQLPKTEAPQYGEELEKKQRFRPRTAHGAAVCGKSWLRDEILQFINNCEEGVDMMRLNQPSTPNDLSTEVGRARERLAKHHNTFREKQIYALQREAKLLRLLYAASSYMPPDLVQKQGEAAIKDFLSQEPQTELGKTLATVIELVLREMSPADRIAHLAIMPNHVCRKFFTVPPGMLEAPDDPNIEVIHSLEGSEAVDIRRRK